MGLFEHRSALWSRETDLSLVILSLRESRRFQYSMCLPQMPAFVRQQKRKALSQSESHHTSRRRYYSDSRQANTAIVR